MLAVHHKGIRVRKKAFQKARTDTMCLPLKIRERAPEPPARQMIPNKAESRKALARDPFHPENRDIYCRKQLRYAAKPQEKRRMRCPRTWPVCSHVASMASTRCHVASTPSMRSD